MLWCLVGLGCVPVASDLGGSIPPPTIDSGGAIQPIDPNANLNGSAEDAQVFAVSVAGHSLAVDAIVIGAQLSVVERTDAFGERTIVEVTLQDTQNTAPVGDTGIVGGIILTASRGSLGGFDLSGGLDGSIVAVFSQGIGQATSDRFVLPEGAQAFVPGDLGITYEVGGGSRFSFVIDGERVTGAFELNGIPLAALEEAEVYEGTFTGTLTR